MPDTPTPLATATDLTDTLPGLDQLVDAWTQPQQDRLMIRATRAIESRCDRRLAPFTLTESHRAEGVDAVGVETNGWPLDLIAALGRSKAMAYGATSLVRDVWLNEYAPLYPEMWTYSGVTVTLARAYGDTENVLGSALEGPEPDSGHFRFRLGTFVPVGTTVRISYSGGYTTVPEDLNTAACYEAAKIAILSSEPQQRSGLNLDELEAEILSLLSPFIRS